MCISNIFINFAYTNYLNRMNITEELGKAIYQERKGRKMSRQKLSDMTGVSHQQIANIEKGHNSSVEILQKVLDALDYEIIICKKQNNNNTEEL